jgi:sugar O-acyltransferase (sialic acid O-acetyltransferase NeuD family)
MEISGFTVDDHCISATASTFCGLPLVPFSSVQKVYDPHIYQILIVVGFAEMNELRDRKYAEAAEKGYSFASYIHPSMHIHDDVLIDPGCIILENVTIHPGSRIGSRTFISSNVSIGHDCIIKSSNWINSGVSMAGNCVICEGCFFGVNSSVADAIHIGARNIIGANTLINKNTGENEVHISEGGQRFPLSSKEFLKFTRG